VAASVAHVGTVRVKKSTTFDFGMVRWVKAFRTGTRGISKAALKVQARLSPRDQDSLFPAAVPKLAPVSRCCSNKLSQVRPPEADKVQRPIYTCASSTRIDRNSLSALTTIHYQIRASLMFRLACIVAVVFISQPAWSMSSPGPSALHVLIKMSDVIAVVNVAERFENGFGEGQVKARIDQVVYGDVKPGHLITISEFDLNGCAGPPAKYEVGQRVLVLLRGNQRQGYQACGNLHGARVLNDDQQAQCIKRIKEFYRIRAVKDVENRKLFWTEWAVRCAEQPSTLADGLALLGRGTRLEFGVDPKPGEPTWYFPLLNLEQKRRLFKVLEGVLESKRMSKELCDLMRVISYVDQDKDLREIALNAEKELSLPVRTGSRTNRDEWIVKKLTPFLDAFIQHEQTLPLNGG
jgi:hypothetical protein